MSTEKSPSSATKTLIRILVVSEDRELVKKLSSEFNGRGITPFDLPDAKLTEVKCDLVLVDLDGTTATRAKFQEQIQRLDSTKVLPVIALVSASALDGLGKDPDPDDFILKPYRPEEAAARIKWALARKDAKYLTEVISCGDLTIDLSRCEVSVKGQPLLLTYKEYELLRLMAKHKGKVFTREALLNKIWGYDYYGGERTVDVHIRRLRSKLEDAGQYPIETVRNIGYRFRDYKLNITSQAPQNKPQRHL